MSEENRPTLLLVDDEPNILSSLQRLLRRDGYTLLACDSPHEALELLTRQPVVVVLADHRMPGMSGVEFLRRARRLCPDTVRIVLSGYTDFQFAADAINEGAIYKFLTKPWDDDQLREQIRAACRDKALAEENRRLNDALRAANEALRESLAERELQARRIGTVLGTLQEVLQLIPWPIVGVDEDGLVALANMAADERLAQPGESLLGRRAAEALPPGLRHCVEAHATAPQDDAQFDGYRLVCRSMGGLSGSRGKLLALLPCGVCQ